MDHPDSKWNSFKRSLNSVKKISWFIDFSGSGSCFLVTNNKYKNQIYNAYKGKWYFSIFSFNERI